MKPTWFYEWPCVVRHRESVQPIFHNISESAFKVTLALEDAAFFAEGCTILAAVAVHMPLSVISCRSKQETHEKFET